MLGGDYATDRLEFQHLYVIVFMVACTKVRAAKNVLHRQISTLTAYRKSLIHECVTGQRRITEEDVLQAQNGRAPI